MTVRRRAGLHRRLSAVIASIAVAGVLSGPAIAQSIAPSISVLSSRPDMVSDGAALIEIVAPAGGRASNVRVRLNGTEITRSLQRDGTRLVGLVSGLRLGENTIVARAGGRQSTLLLQNHDRNGPILSGPHQTPFICETDRFQLPDGSMLGPSIDTNCNADTRVLYVYRRVGGEGFVPLPSTQSLPTDVATTTTTAGTVVNYIVRLETGTLNRAIYQSAVLYDPTRDPPPGPLAHYVGWNRKIVYSFGGSLSAGYHQGTQRDYSPADVLTEDEKLSRGFAVLSSTLNISGVNPSDVLSAETVSMVKERFIETFGAPIYTMGWGGSGGSMQQHLIASNYPGLLDGIIPAASFSDTQSIVPSAMDCALLERVFQAAGGSWSEAQQTAVSGFNTWQTCVSWNRIFSPMWMRSDQIEVRAFGLDLSNCAMVVPRASLFDSARNPTGERCDIYSGIRNLLGVDPETGRARRAFDNIGVQYGLKAFHDGVISAEQFVTLNEQIGGFDDNGAFQTSRTEADPVALRNLYAYGRIVDGRGLRDVPIIDFRNDPGAYPDVHDNVRSLTTRARLVRANGTAENQVILRQDATPTPAGSAAAPMTLSLYVMLKMDEWLSNIIADHGAHASTSERVIANRPADLVDACVTATGERIPDLANSNGSSRCSELMPFHSNPRMVAGGPITDDVLKCSLVPLGRDARLSERQWARLRAVFASGVCDHAAPGVGAQAAEGPWLVYSEPGVAAPAH